MKNKIRFWLYFIAAIILGIYISTRIVMTFLGHGTCAVVHNISISADLHDKDLTALATAAAVAPGTHTYSVNLDAINARVAAVPGVKESAVRRMPNGNLAVRVKLYKKVALWTDGENYFPLSGDGTIVQKPTDTRDAGAIVFRGDVPDDITEITNAAHSLSDKIDYVELVEHRRWDIYTTNGIRIMLPEEKPVDAISGLLVLDKNHQILSRNLQLIDMRDTARILVR